MDQYLQNSRMPLEERYFENRIDAIFLASRERPWLRSGQRGRAW